MSHSLLNGLGFVRKKTFFSFKVVTKDAFNVCEVFMNSSEHSIFIINALGFAISCHYGHS